MSFLVIRVGIVEGKINLHTGLTLVTTMGSVLENVELSQEHFRTDGEILYRRVVSELFGKTAVAGGLRLLEMRQ